MTPATKCRLAIAMTALAAYAACGDDPVEEAGPVAHENPHPDVRYSQETAADYELPAPRPAVRVARSRPRPATPAHTRPAGGGDTWAALRQCENGGSYTSDPGDRYRGAYQFDRGTWASLGYTGDPADAPPAVQDEAARRLQARSGWGQWPRCSKRLGLR